jgi:ABC-2 type transport system permease protein
MAQANSLNTVIVLVMASLGGAWWPLEIVPQWMQTLGRFFPTSWAMTGFHDIITRGLGVTAVLPEVAVLIVFGTIFLTIGTWRFRYE